MNHVERFRAVMNFQTVDRLEDWTRRPEEGIRYYSGTATYRKTFDRPSGPGRVQLDLGGVEVIAKVRPNGREVGTPWKQPYVADITEALRAGSNELEVEVINTWWNRLVGDEQPGVTWRWTSTTRKAWSAKDALPPAGLLGSVRILCDLPTAGVRPSSSAPESVTR